MRKRISIGVVESINQNSEVKYGGAVVSPERTSQDVNFKSTKAKKMKTKMTMTEIKRSKNRSKINLYDVSVAKRLVTPLISAIEIQT